MHSRLHKVLGGRVRYTSTICSLNSLGITVKNETGDVDRRQTKRSTALPVAAHARTRGNTNTHPHLDVVFSQS